MSKRLQVVLDEAEMNEIRDIARRRHMTVSEWVRQALRVARRNEPRAATALKLEAIKTAVSHSFPSGDIDEMLSQIQMGILESPSE